MVMSEILLMDMTKSLCLPYRGKHNRNGERVLEFEGF